ncbi:hypothetical protein BZG36_03933 [Bifiguratus adelaidae]|uniref:CSC1/OSCA1-like 7TM region domain-containing protein n=1 Tax=Bifiguratus adelaidae TaxID=1938954 RepID=A0A261XZ53_9FUNG|nr:hypothetical protein BZG36_03933 [Bifiguratus adelaidae]
MSNNTNVNQQAFSEQEMPISSFISAVAFNGAIAVAMFVGFEILRRVSPRIYSPKTFLVDQIERMPAASKYPLGWIWSVLKLKDDDIIKHAGLDSYMFLKFIRLNLKLFFLYTILGCCILIPVDIVGTSSPRNNLASYSIGNTNPSLVPSIGSSSGARLWGHLIIAYIFFGYLLYTLRRQFLSYIRIRQQYLTSKSHNATPQANTVLICDIPDELNDEEVLYKMFNVMPGGVANIWINRNSNHIVKLVQKREKLIKDLETASTKLIKGAQKYAQKHPEQFPQLQEYAATQTELQQDPSLMQAQQAGGPQVPKPAYDVSQLPSELRPTARSLTLPLQAHLPSLIPGLGQKDDVITKKQQELIALNNEILHQQQQFKSFPKLRSAFIQFRSQMAAHMVAQSLVHHEPLACEPRYVEVAPPDVIWENLHLTCEAVIARRAISNVIVAGMIVFWGVITGLFSSLAQYKAITNFFTALKGLSGIANTAAGAIQGILPTLLVAILMSVLPMILRFLSRFEGNVRKTTVDLDLMDKYYAFLVFNVVFVATVVNAAASATTASNAAASATGVVNQFGSYAQNPTEFLSVIGSKFPGAANFFVSYALLQGLSGSASEILQIFTLIIHYITGVLFTSTPRQVWGVRWNLSEFDWGTRFPQHTLITTIGLVYAPIAPLILPFITIYFALYYVVFTYQLIYVYHQELQSGGLAFPKAIFQLFFGASLAELVLAAYFFTQIPTTGPQAIAQAVLMLALLGFTIGMWLVCKFQFDPLVEYLAIDLLQLGQDFGIGAHPTAAMREMKAKLDGEGNFTERTAQDKLNSQIRNQASQEVPPQGQSTAYNGYHGDLEDGNAETKQGLPGQLGARLRGLGNQFRKVGVDVNNQLTGNVRNAMAVMREDNNNFEQDFDFGFNRSKGAGLDGAENYDDVYLHPAIVTPLPTIWLPQDILGVAQTQVEDYRTNGLNSTTEGAALTRKGRVTVSGDPPDLEYFARQ